MPTTAPRAWRLMNGTTEWVAPSDICTKTISAKGDPLSAQAQDRRVGLSRDTAHRVSWTIRQERRSIRDDVVVVGIRHLGTLSKLTDLISWDMCLRLPFTHAVVDIPSRVSLWVPLLASRTLAQRRCSVVSIWCPFFAGNIETGRERIDGIDCRQDVDNPTDGGKALIQQARAGSGGQESLPPSHQPKIKSLLSIT